MTIPDKDGATRDSSEARRCDERWFRVSDGREVQCIHEYGHKGAHTGGALPPLGGVSVLNASCPGEAPHTAQSYAPEDHQKARALVRIYAGDKWFAGEKSAPGLDWLVQCIAASLADERRRSEAARPEYRADEYRKALETIAMTKGISKRIYNLAADALCWVRSISTEPDEPRPEASPTACVTCGSVADQDLVDLVLAFVAVQEDTFKVYFEEEDISRVPRPWRYAYIAMHRRAQADCESSKAGESARLLADVRRETIEECALAIEADRDRVSGSEGMMLGESCIYDVCVITVRALLKGGKSDV